MTDNLSIGVYAFPMHMFTSLLVEERRATLGEDNSLFKAHVN